ncbi:MAG: response regulator transcription factor [Verrucomicrobia bacterium]|nr:response regulator transcription factor [Verrucomicrobiota bacterium]
MQKQIFIADDHPIFRHGLRKLIEKQPSFKVIGDAGDGEAALGEIKRLKPDIAILDVNLPKMSGIEVARAIRRANSLMVVVFLTMRNDEGTFNTAMDLGAQGYILKENAVQDLMLALNTVASGGIYLSPSISGYLVRRNQRASALREEKRGLKSLTKTERAVLRLVAENKTNKEIGAELGMSYRTVEVHRKHMCEKLELEGTRALFVFAVEHKYEL